MQIEVWTGGQTGVDQAALRAARALGLRTGGVAPAGWRTEDGPAPWLAAYGLDQGPSSYADRTRRVLGAAEALLLLTTRPSPGSRLTWRYPA